MLKRSQILSAEPDVCADRLVYEANDPADLIEFAQTPQGIPSADFRSADELRHEAMNAADPIDRDRALWELAAQERRGSLKALLAHTMESAVSIDQQVSALWCAQKHMSHGASAFLKHYADHPVADVGAWARMLLRETERQWSATPDEREAAWIPNAPFDQVLPLMIGGFACVKIAEGYYVRVALSPLWFEEVFGRVMACTNQADFDRNLVIEKRLKNYHSDGSHHYEVFKFSGFTFDLGAGVTEHIYESIACHTFYPSGKVEDYSVDPIGDARVILNRKARPWTVPPAKVRPVQPKPGGGYNDPTGQFETPAFVVDSVRGRFMGYAHVNLERFVASGRRLGAGEAQLCSLHHPATRDFVNVFIHGSFKGRLMDRDGDGVLDVNTLPVHATRSGELDFAGKGVANADPFDPFKLV